jgi:hypothetical protein
MDDPVPALGMPAPLEQGPDIFQAELDAESLEAIQIIEALPVVHG